MRQYFAAQQQRALVRRRTTTCADERLRLDWHSPTVTTAKPSSGSTLWHKERNVMGHLPERDRPSDQSPDAHSGGSRPITRARSSNCSGARTSSSTPIPAPAAPYVKGWTRRSP